MVGCIDEKNTDDCAITYTLVVKAYDLSGKALSSEEVSDVSLFIFDGNYTFIERIDTRINESIAIQVPRAEDAHFVAWGNVVGECYAYAPILPGDPKDVSFIHLLPDPRSDAHYLSSNDLFLGERNISDSKQASEIVVPIYRQVGSLAITVRHLNTFTGYDDGDYSIVVRESHSVLDFSGRPSGKKVTFRPDGSYVAGSDNKGEFYVPPFYLLPEANTIYIDIYRESQLIASVSENTDGKPITIQTGVLTNVLIDLRAMISVSVSLTPWGKAQIWKEF